MFSTNDKVLLAVSGGKDSVLMAHLFNEAHFTFGIAHCNFKLREEDSDEDENFSQKLAEQFGVPFFTTTFDTDAYSKQHKISIQMAARELRYRWFEEVRRDNDYQFIAVAHHQNDTVETVLLNLVRGTGIAGLHGIAAKRDKLIRPLLFLKREEIDGIIINNQLAYREDISNSSTKYARNKIRLEVIPKLKDLNPFLENTFEENSRRFKELEDFLNIQTKQLRKTIFQFNPSGDIKINLESLKELQPRKLLLYELFRPYNFSEYVLDDLISAWDGQPGKKFESSTHTLLLDRNSLILSAIRESKKTETLIYKNDHRIIWEAFTFQSGELDAGIKMDFNSDIAFFDEALLQFPLKLRHWNKGDYFYPFGMRGKKKISDFFTSLKLPLTEKERIPILENGNGDILWVAGYRSDERYKITSNTKKVFILEKQKQ
ncbi:MAG: tRNA lysidine(34) synthetase TilS [Sphingobacteriaceae bacterium]